LRSCLPRGCRNDAKLKESYWRFLGVDPGEGNLVAIAERLTAGHEGNRLGCSTRPSKSIEGRKAMRKAHGESNARGERVATYVLHQGDLDRKSGRLKHLAQSATWRREVAKEHALLSTVSRKTSRIDRLSAYHEVAHSVAEKCWANRSKRRIPHAAFGVWSRSTAAIDSFWSGVLRGRACDGTLGFEGRTILGYGNGSWGGGRGPHKRILDSAKRIFGRARVFMVDEFNTSKTCHVCGDFLRDIIDRPKNMSKGRPAGAVVRGLKHCLRSSCSSYLDRDVNVSIPLLVVYVLIIPPPPPPCLLVCTRY
jgi:hypothetical protein